MSRFFLSTWSCVVAVRTGIKTETILTPLGPLQGNVGPIARSFRGIPYAQPLSAANRFEKSLPVKPWTQTLEAVTDPPACPQHCKLPYAVCPLQTSEDCLFLNIFSPLNASSRSLPVLYFIHGGDYKQGYAGGVLYDGSVLAAQKDVVVVSVQYRLGALGFLWTGPDHHSIAGNLGTHDQEQGLRFVKRVIGSFGGDPSRVTIFGQSAGGASVATLIATPSARGLFHAAILQSQPFGIPFRTVNTWPKFADKFVTSVGCVAGEDLRVCLQNATLETILSAQIAAEKDKVAEVGHFFNLFEPWTPTVGSPELPMQTFACFTGKASVGSVDIPIVIGTVKDEGTIFVYEAFPKPLSSVEEEGLFIETFGAKHVLAILHRYPLAPSETHDVRNRTSRVVTDGLFHCPARRVALARAEANRRSWQYHFDHVAAFMAPVWGNRTDPYNAPECVDRVCHSEELGFVFHANLSRLPGVPTWAKEPAESHLSYSMVDYWGNFAHDLQPGSSATGSNCTSPLEWPLMNATRQLTMQFKTVGGGNTVLSGADSTRCRFWDKTGYDWL